MTPITGTSSSSFVPGVAGESALGIGVRGRSKFGVGVKGLSEHGVGVQGESGEGAGVSGQSASGVGVSGISDSFEGMHAETNSLTVAAIAAYNLNEEGTGAAIFAKKNGNQGAAGFFDGDVYITKKLTVVGDIVLENADCAEDFDIADEDRIEPGTVMVLGDEEGLYKSDRPYDKRVAGVVSGAGDYKPGLLLDKRQSQSARKPIALLGKVYCKVDAAYAPIDVGDLLTTSATPGHAMKVVDPLRAFGAVIGKALRPLNDGQGLIPILVALQ